MISFLNDYSEGAHPAIMEALMIANTEQHAGYGLDDYSIAAADRIKEVFGCPGADVHFIGGGTQANMLALSSFLRPHEAVICAEEGHIAVHETGAIEASGHKVLTVKSRPGAKITPDDIEPMFSAHTDEHMVKPRMVFISDSTEWGGVYRKAELAALSDYCRAKGLLLYLDGARLGSALSSAANDLEPSDLAEYCDAFYIGGTKNGMLCGEALVIVNDGLKADFRYFMKQKGAMPAKGFVIGAQFERAFRDDLYFRMAAKANIQAKRIADALQEAGISMLCPAESNQIFPIFTNEKLSELHKSFGFYDWQKVTDGTSAIRLVCSWATSCAAADAFIKAALS